jgi:hypothetical protein
LRSTICAADIAGGPLAAGAFAAAPSPTMGEANRQQLKSIFRYIN